MGRRQAFNVQVAAASVGKVVSESQLNRGISKALQVPKSQVKVQLSTQSNSQQQQLTTEVQIHSGQTVHIAEILDKVGDAARFSTLLEEHLARHIKSTALQVTVSLPTVLKPSAASQQTTNDPNFLLLEIIAVLLAVACGCFCGTLEVRFPGDTKRQTGLARKQRSLAELEDYWEQVGGVEFILLC